MERLLRHEKDGRSTACARNAREALKIRLAITIALKQLESRAAIEGDGYGGLRGTYFAERRIQAAVGAMHGG